MESQQGNIDVSTNLIYDGMAVSSPFIMGIIKSIIIFGILPLIIWLIPFTITKILGTSIKLKDYVLQFGIAFIPIIAAAHLSKAILKTTSRVPYLRHLFEDVTGMSTTQKILDGEIALQQTPEWVKISVSLLLTLVIVAGIWLSIKVVRKLYIKADKPGAMKPFYLIPITYGGIFLIMILTWRWFS